MTARAVGPAPRRGRLALALAAAVPLVLGGAGGTAPAATSGAGEPPWAELARTPVTPDMVQRATLRPTGGPLALVGGPLALVREKSVRELARESQGVTTLTSDLLFGFDSAALAPGADAALGELAAALPQGAAVAVDGHTDGLGGDEVNVPLSQARAQAVAGALAAARPDLVLTVTGHGSSVPVAEEQVDGRDDPSGRALNRRVEVRVTG
ncbi:OmpA family protein [Cellulomonas sp. Sa3CUA2]|uniref:OmpA family protein n=1 Tax=Cellulomonas avistercoris TaxID=2762242 RepID=A0ABR8QDM1_9CELL|nr:OmpA family protein [Cellulomonas avistercoris]MBD7918475.1 OmpA family protein [Cellulomonas avistercoris]